MSDELLPAGTYRVVADDDELPGMTFLAYRRIATTLMTPSIDAPAHTSRAALSISPTELEAALTKDQHHTL